MTRLPIFLFILDPPGQAYLAKEPHWCDMTHISTLTKSQCFLLLCLVLFCQVGLELCIWGQP